MWIRTVNGMIWIEIQFTSQGLIYPKQTNEHNTLVNTNRRSRNIILNKNSNTPISNEDSKTTA